MKTTYACMPVVHFRPHQGHKGTERAKLDAQTFGMWPLNRETEMENLRRVLARRLLQFMEETPTLSSQTKLGTASGVAQSTIGRILRADVAVTLDVVQAIADALGVEAVDLLIDPRAARGAEAEAADLLVRTLARMHHTDKQKVLDYARFLTAQSLPRSSTSRRQKTELNGVAEGSLPPAETAGIKRQARSEVQTDDLRELDSSHAANKTRPRPPTRRKRDRG